MHIAYHVLTELNVLDPKFDIPLKQKKKVTFWAVGMDTCTCIKNENKIK